MNPSEMYLCPAMSFTRGINPTARPVIMDGIVNPYRGMTRNPKTGSATMPLAEEMVYTTPVLLPALSALADNLRIRNVGIMPRKSRGGRIKIRLTRITAAPGVIYREAIVNQCEQAGISTR